MAPGKSMDETVQRPMGRGADERLPSAQLRVVFPESLVATVSLQQREVVLGRRPGDGGHKIDDPTVSRRHFVIGYDSGTGQHHGGDLGSRNGSRIEGRDVRAEDPPTPLSDGDVIRVGDVLTVYESSGAVDAEDAPDVSSDAIPGDAAKTVQLRGAVATAARDPSSILLIGETGTGKEYIAGEVHRLSGRSGPMVAVNCAALSPQLIESQLFGHAKGAFTGAHSAHQGLFRAADGGTIFLDEVGELPRELQPKLLRVLQEREVHPVGETRPVAIDVRVISATLCDLTQMIDDGSFRLDLYARLSPWEIPVPALRERRADLVQWIARLHQQWHENRDREATPPLRLEADAVERLLLDDWTENLRGLFRLVHRSCSEPGSGIDILRSRSGTRKREAPDDPVAAAPPKAAPKVKRHKPSKEELEQTLQEHGGSIRATAKHYGRDRRQIYRWMEQYGLRDTEA